MASPIAHFFKHVGALERAYTNCSFSFVAVRQRGQLYIIQGIIRLNTGTSRPPSRYFESKNVLAAHYRLPEDLGFGPQALCEQLMSVSELLSTPHGDVKFVPASPPDPAVRRTPLHPEGLQNQQRINVLTLLGRRQNRFLDQPALDWELKASPTPYEHIQDLLFDFGLGQLRDDYPTVEVIAFPVLVVDANSRVDGTTAVINIRAADGLLTDNVTLGYKVVSQGAVSARSSVSGATLDWVRAPDGVLTAQVNISVPDAAMVNCIASYDGVAQHFWWILDPARAQNPRRAAYEVSDPGLEVLREYLSGKGKHGQDDFETGVATLLWILGFSPAHLGANVKLEAADIILATPRQRLAVVECTTGMLKADKLSRLIERTERVKQQVPAITSVLPVIVTSKVRMEVRVDLEAAAKQGVLVLSKEQLDNGLEIRTLLLPDADALYDEAERAVSEAQARYLREPETEPELDLGGDSGA
jgi:hypothetical protein